MNGNPAIVKEAGGESVTKQPNNKIWQSTEPLIHEWKSEPDLVSGLKKWANSVIVCRSGLADYITTNMSSKTPVIKKIGKLFT